MDKSKLPRTKASVKEAEFYFGYALSFRDLSTDCDYTLVSSSKSGLINMADGIMPQLFIDPSFIQPVCITKQENVEILPEDGE